MEEQFLQVINAMVHLNGVMLTGDLIVLMDLTKSLSNAAKLKTQLIMMTIAQLLLAKAMLHLSQEIS